MKRHTTHDVIVSTSWLSFGTARRRVHLPATLSGALSRPGLVYPLASLDVSGQWLISTQLPRLTRFDYLRHYTTA